jgi:hypothetical protein
MSKNNELTLGGGIDLSLCGRYRLQVIDATTKVIISDYGWNKNLILNNGMDAIAGNLIASLTPYGICGSGSRPNRITSSTSQISQSGAQIYLMDTSGLTDFTSSVFTNGTMSYTSRAQIGDVIIDSDNSQSMILSVPSDGLNLFVNVSQSFTGGKTFTIWKTSQTHLQGEVHRSSAYILVGSSSLLGWNQGTYVSASVMTHRRTYDFAVESATQSYKEVGIGWSPTLNDTAVFSRAVLPNSVSVVPNQQLRMTYDLQVTFGPTSVRYKTPTITGWPVPPSTTTEMSESMQLFYGGFSNNWMASAVNTDGGNTGWPVLDPTGRVASWDGYSSYGCSMFVSSNSASLVPFGSCVDRSTNGYLAFPVLDPYIPGSYVIYKRATFDVSSANVTNIRSVGFGLYYYLGGDIYSRPYWGNAQAFCCVFTQPQTKTNLQTLTLGWKSTWARVIQ